MFIMKLQAMIGTVRFFNTLYQRVGNGESSAKEIEAEYHP